MSDLPIWLWIAGILVLALGMYILAWRIVEGTHVVVRAVTRVLLGAVIVVPAILFFVFGPGGALKQEEMADKAAPSQQMERPVVPEQDEKAEAAPSEDEAKAEQERRRADATKEKQAGDGIVKKLGSEPDQKSAASSDDKAAPSDVSDAEGESETASEPAMADRSSEESAPAPLREEETAAAPSDAGEADTPAAANGASEDGTTTPVTRPSQRPVRRYYKRSNERGFSYRQRAGAPRSSGAGSASRGPASVPSGPSAAGSGSSAPDSSAEVGAAREMAAPEAAESEEAIEPAPPTSMPDVALIEPPRDGLGNLESLPIPGAPPASDSPAAPGSPSATAAPEAPAASTEAADKEEEKDWSVVPVFYGTDRQRTDTTERVTYDWQRGRKLELGRALVTIPKQHQVPMVERPWAIVIPYLDIKLYEAEEDPKKHFTLEDIKALTKEEFLALVRERLGASERFNDHALVFVHGYKTKFDNALFRTAQIAYDLKFDGAAFLYSWPSGGTLQGYTYDRESAAQSEPYLRKFLQMVRDETGAKKLSIIAHSMGNQPLLRVLQDLKHTLPEGVLISQLILAAPDVDRDNFENIVSSITGIADGITLYAAANDTALQVSRRVNGGIPRAGDVPASGPVVIKGIDTIDATATSMDSVGINHSGYAENNALLEDIGKLISTGIRPPEVRLPELERVETEKGNYWRYPAKVRP